MTATGYHGSNLSQERPAPTRIDNLADVVFMTADELGAKLRVRTSWIREMSKKSRSRDPIPLVKFGRHNRYGWGSKALNAWISRRFS